jgi:hypothetical protein
MIFRVVLRSLTTRPLRTAVLAAGFGLAIAVMAELLGVGEVILEQAHSPALRGGGDIVIGGTFGSVDNARFILSNVIGSEPLRSRVAAASPSRRANLYLITSHDRVPVSVRGGIPTLEKAVGDPEVAGMRAWVDAPDDAKWSAPDQGEILRAMDRFHPVPPPPPVASGFSRTPDGFSRNSWAEWLYFNGRSPDGEVRFYLTFLTGPLDANRQRQAVVRLQLDRTGRSTNYSASATIDDGALLQHAPDLDIGGNRVRLEGSRYHLTLALSREMRGRAAQSRNGDVHGDITLDAPRGRSLPPAAIQGAHGWVSGYVAPVLSGAVHGSLTVDGERVAFDGLVGYHDHNWGFWEGVRWQWGQVAHGDMSILFGRVFPPPSVADPDRVPGFLGVLGPEGPIAFSTSVDIQEQGNPTAPQTITIRATGEQLDVRLALSVEESVRTRMALTQSSTGTAMDFLQLGGVYQVSGHAAGRDITFTARGSAETFRPGEPPDIRANNSRIPNSRFRIPK